MEVCDRIGKGVDSGIDFKVVSVDGIIFGLNDVSEMGYSEVFFNGLNDGKYMGSLNDGTVLDWYDIHRNNAAGFRIGVG